jgi:tyrosine-protein phosphatase YwqE
VLEKLFKSRPSQIPGKFLHTDMHSHIIPGIDDGAKTVKESLALCSAFRDLGYRQLIATPHIYQEIYPNKESDIKQKKAKLQQELDNNGIAINLVAGAEYYLDEFFIKKIEAREVLSFGDNYVLFEMAYLNKPKLLDEAIFALQTGGYKPVLAHPERYAYYFQHVEELQELRTKGVYLQINLLSFMGFYSKEVMKTSKTLWKNHLVDFIGSDCHNLYQASLLKKAFNHRILSDFEEHSLLNVRLY